MKNNIDSYSSNPKGLEEEMDMYSIKEVLSGLNNSSHIFDNFEKESMIVEKDALEQIEDFNLLLKIRKLSSEIKGKKAINEKLSTLHFHLNLLKNADIKGAKQIRNAMNLFFYNNDTKIDSIISELNDFKHKINEVKKHHENLLPKSLDNKLKIEGKYGKHIENLHSMHKRQKTALVSLVRLFLKQAKQHIKSLKRFK
ncbi:hypothetical protein HYT53_00965 [Candidatus Woesearchaeota archaeon]|nr:hypothetical protein [Candidatus Woesearchaeota archaeon]